MPLAATNRFYQLAKSMTGDEIKAAALREVTGEHKETHKYENEGRFLPLGVWGKQGYDEDNIKKNADPQDMQWNEKWKWMEYRIRVEIDSTGKQDTVSDAVTLASNAKGPKRRRTCALEDAARAPASRALEDAARAPASPSPAPSSDDEEPSDEDSGSDSDDRESSRRRRPKAKGKGKAKAKPKAKAKQAPKTAEQVETSKKAKQQKTKVASALKTFRESTMHQHILDVSQPILDAAKANIHMLDALQTRLDASCTTGVDDGCVASAVELDWPSLKHADRELRDALKTREKNQDKKKKQQKK